MKPEKQDTRHYRIGEYAQKMGVTPDLLKHYERMGLIHSETTPSGYRYYPFHETLVLLECLMLRNYGIPLQEMNRLLYEDDVSQFHAYLDTKAETIRKHMLLEEAVLNDQRLFSQWMTRMEGRETYVLIEEKEDMFFLPHSRHRDFLDDSRIQDLLSDWVSWMPAVKIARLIPDLAGDNVPGRSSWGLAVPGRLVEKYAIPINDVVCRIPGGRKLMLHYQVSRRKDLRDRALQVLEDHMDKVPERSSGPVLQIVLANLRFGGEGNSCGWFAIPYEE